MIVFSHPTGNQNVRAIVTSLFDEGMLTEFHTSLSIDPGSLWVKLLPEKIRKDFVRRAFLLPEKKIYTHSYLEFLRLLFTKIHLDYFVRREHGFASVDAIYHKIDKSVAKRLGVLNKSNKVKAVYAYEDGALATFSLAKKLGLTCIYDLPIAYWETARRLMNEEAERLPNWANTLGGGINDSPMKLERKTKELELADVIIYPGKFVEDSLPAWATQKKLIMAPFGSPNVSGAINFKTKDEVVKGKRPLRVLFVGSMGQRKGLGDLFAAMQLLNRQDFELVVLGSLLAPIDFYKNQFPNFIYEPGRPNSEVLELMRSCDVFCLPSIVEGRALVMQEAMSQGLPIIITPNTGGEDLIIDGCTGFLVPIRSPEIIAEKLNWFNENRSKLTEMSNFAKAHADKYTWTNYTSKIIEGINNTIN
ncbi:MAG: glycosyltransferase family 4 protein [Bacteroidota bacterium]|nr:glycosyltransferase family 4 protein [Bacteroidota bacterium]